jgi:hypothetical protein
VYTKRAIPYLNTHVQATELLYVYTVLRLPVPPPRPPDPVIGVLQLGILLQTGKTLILQRV